MNQPHDIINLIMTYCVEPIYKISYTDLLNEDGSSSDSKYISDPRVARFIIKWIKFMKKSIIGITNSIIPWCVELVTHPKILPHLQNIDNLNIIHLGKNKTTNPEFSSWVGKKVIEYTETYGNKTSQYDKYEFINYYASDCKNMFWALHYFSSIDSRSDKLALITNMDDPKFFDELFRIHPGLKRDNGILSIINQNPKLLDWLNSHPKFITNQIMKNPSIEILHIIYNVLFGMSYISKYNTGNIVRKIQKFATRPNRCPTHPFFDVLRNYKQIPEKDFYTTPTIINKIKDPEYFNARIEKYKRKISNDDMFENKFGSRLTKYVSRYI